jgi:hypothetical protein
MRRLAVMDVGGFSVTALLLATVLIVGVRPDDRFGRFVLATFTAG